jgi:hypothetical protein
MASNLDTNVQVEEAILNVSKKMLDASASVRKLNWTRIETYARNVGESRLLLPKEIGPAMQPYCSVCRYGG